MWPCGEYLVFSFLVLVKQKIYSVNISFLPMSSRLNKINTAMNSGVRNSCFSISA